ncbi:hypothetical protein WN48_08755 [Eufriesea mexicana]|nr:hypothetical protein WN48_08755 [Eufriesea mexicana]
MSLNVCNQQWTVVFKPLIRKVVIETTGYLKQLNIPTEQSEMPSMRQVDMQERECKWYALHFATMIVLYTKSEVILFPFQRICDIKENSVRRIIYGSREKSADRGKRAQPDVQRARLMEFGAWEGNSFSRGNIGGENIDPDNFGIDAGLYQLDLDFHLGNISLYIEPDRKQILQIPVGEIRFSWKYSVHTEEMDDSASPFAIRPRLLRSATPEEGIDGKGGEKSRMHGHANG